MDLYQIILHVKILFAKVIIEFYPVLRVMLLFLSSTERVRSHEISRTDGQLDEERNRKTVSYR